MAKGIYFERTPTRLLQGIGILFALLCTAVRGSDNSSVQIEPSTREMTPGQQFELHLTVTHNDGIEAVFNPSQQPWKDLEFIDYGMTGPRWQQNQWVSTYTLQVAASVAGHYKLPALRVSFYQEADNWNLETTALPYDVISLFLGPPEIQPLLSLPAIPAPAAPLSPLTLFILMPLVLTGMLIGWHFGVSRIKPVHLWSQSLKSPEILAQQALHDGVIDWESLRMWLIVESGSDPLGQLTTQERLLHQYQQIRFKQGTDHQAYAALCHRCQERWG